MKKQAITLTFVIASLSAASPRGDARAQTSDERSRALVPLFLEAGRAYGVDPGLLWTVGWIESRFRSHVRSPKGAGGVMQLMPATAVRFGVQDRFDPRASVHGGAKYLRYLLDLFGGDIQLALASYNAGEGAVMRYGRRVPPYRETREYVRRGTDLFARVRGTNLSPGAVPFRPSVPTEAPPGAKKTLSPAPAAPSKPSRESFMPEVVAMDELAPVDVFAHQVEP